MNPWLAFVVGVFVGMLFLLGVSLMLMAGRSSRWEEERARRDQEKL